jgi:Tfp pilus assembly protein PilF/ribonuclease BN (tRNA processing enzyme)
MPRQTQTSGVPTRSPKFNQLFWVAREEHSRLRETAEQGLAHKAAMAFARLRGWKWAVALLEASRLEWVDDLEGAMRLLTESDPVPAPWIGYREFLRGFALQGMGEYDRAIEAYRKALEDPRFDQPGKAWNNLGKVLHDKGEYGLAIEAYRKGLEDPNETPGDVWNNVGNALDAKGEHNQAIEAYRTALEDPGVVSPGKTWNNLGGAFFATGEYRQAIESYHKALGDPALDTPGIVWYNLGNALSAKGEHDQAIEAYHKALDDPRYTSRGDAWHNLGNALSAKDEYDQAIEAYHRALEDPKLGPPGETWGNLGGALFAKGEYDEAMKVYQKALDDPGLNTPGIVWYNLGNTLDAKGEYDQAIEAYRKALEDSKQDTPGNVWNNMGTVFEAKGEYDQAIEAYRKALEDPRLDLPGETWSNLGGAFFAKGDYEEATDAYRKALDDPGLDTPGIVWNDLGNTLSAAGVHDQAIEAYHRALEDPGLPSPGKVWNNLGGALFARGEYDQAAKAYREAIDDPKYDALSRPWANLALAHAVAGQRQLAEEGFRNALEAPDPDGRAHMTSRLGLLLLQSGIKADALSPNDRAIVTRSLAEPTMEDLEAQIVGAIQDAGDTQYDRYMAKPDSGRDDTLSVLRGWSSAVTLLEGSEMNWRGGGYFLKWRGYGIAIDPGFDFLRNFHDEGFHGREINLVVVSHNHPDHNSDLKDIDDLRYELFKRLAGTASASAQAYVLVWDQDSNDATRFGITSPEHQCEPIVLASGFPQPIDLQAHSAKIPVRLIPFKASHSSDVPHAMGVVFELLDADSHAVVRIGYTADTAYFSDLHSHLAQCDVLIANISQPTVEELQDPSKLKEEHLGYRGGVRLLKECRPKLALVGEFWAGFTDLRILLIKALRQQSGVDAILPAGLGMHIKLPDLGIHCTACGSPVAFSSIKVAPPAEAFGRLGYLCPGCMIS